ncbi:DUF2946 family protein [Phenylobacterium sp.]|uniref:DUF2946 family protein n=1 Tax=Phenylobacterium sp. TaxID=1871053 RepID=UPI00391AFF25
MTSAARHCRTFARLWLALACLAVAIKVLVPPGFMVARPVNDMPFPLVLCTAQGMVTVDPGAPVDQERGDDPAGRAADHGPCVFAGAQHAAPPPGLDHFVAVEFAAYAAPAAAPSVSLAPGRGLAAPPLPARGPPSLSI